MTMPLEIAFVRHGQSEANVVHHANKKNEDHPLQVAVDQRPDWRQRLSPRGIEQAVLARQYIDQHLGGIAAYDTLYVSSFLRTRETASYLSEETGAEWIIDDRITERSWGSYGSLTIEQRKERYPEMVRMHEEDPWYVRLEGGESMLDVSARFRDFQGTLHREESQSRVMVVTHGEFMKAVRYNVERMLPEEWEALENDETYKMRNCTILQYTRVNPHDSSDTREKIRWRRMVYPDAIDRSPDGGEWVELADRRRYVGFELLRQAEIAPRLLSDD